jgi:hypothetical protein
MKLTKQRLKEIIKEELSSLSENCPGPFRDDDAAGPGLGDITTEPRHTAGRAPEQRLLDRLAQRAAVDGYSADEAAAKLGLSDDVEVVEYIQSLLDDQMLAQPGGRPNPFDFRGMEEVTQSGGKSTVPGKEHSEVSYNPTPKTRKEFHKKARKRAKQDIKKGPGHALPLGVDEGLTNSRRRRSAPKKKKK